MHTRLLPLLQHLSHTPPSVHPAGLWLIHSDEPLAVDWLIDACRPVWHHQNQLIKRFELVSPKSWHEVLSELSSLSLFDDHTALIITGKHKPDFKDKALAHAFLQFAVDVKEGNNHNHLLWCLPKQDKKALATKAIDFFEKNGLVIDGNVYDERQRQELLAFKASQFGLSLDNTAWQLLMNSTEKNLLFAYQTLWRLSFVNHNAPIGADTLADSLVAGADFNVFDLSDALLAGNVAKVLKILRHLKNTDTAPSLALWAVAKDARLILQLQANKNPAELGIWQNKVHLYTSSATRTQHISHTWLNQIYATDTAIKGVSHTDAWGELERLCLAVCGVDLGERID